MRKINCAAYLETKHARAQHTVYPLLLPALLLKVLFTESICHLPCLHWCLLPLSSAFVRIFMICPYDAGRSPGAQRQQKVVSLLSFVQHGHCSLLCFDIEQPHHPVLCRFTLCCHGSLDRQCCLTGSQQVGSWPFRSSSSSSACPSTSWSVALN